MVHPSQITTALDRLRSAAQSVTRSLYDDTPHTYVAEVVNVLGTVITAIKQQSARPSADFTIALHAMETMLKVSADNDRWRSFTEDVLGCARRVIGASTGDTFEQELACVATIEAVAKDLCNLPGEFTIDWQDQTFHCALEGRQWVVTPQDSPEEVLFSMGGAVTRARVRAALEFYWLGRNFGWSQGHAELQRRLRVLIGAAVEPTLEN